MLSSTEQSKVVRWNEISPNKRIFYVCSYGGTGSKMLTNFLKHFGKVIHIHNRSPPNQLCYTKKVGGGYDGKFVRHRKILNKNLRKQVTVIYLFRDPTEAQISRWGLNHWRNIGIPLTSRNERALSHPQRYIENNKNILKYEEFHDNYMTSTPTDYTIYAINYHKIFQQGNKETLCQQLRLPQGAINMFPPKKETSGDKWNEYRSELDKLNECENQTEKFRDAPFLQIIK